VRKAAILVETDWLKLWRELVTSTSHIPSGELYQRYKRHALKSGERPDSNLDFVINNLDPSFTVLDIGAGSGRWTIPIAGKSHSVTAVEPAEDMIAILRQNLAARGITNVNIVPSTWENASVEIHDISVSAHAIYSSPDLALIVRKMERFSRHACYLALRLPPADSVIAELTLALYGRHYDSANAMIAYNALYSLGIYCNVLVEDAFLRWTDSSLEEAFARAKRHLLLKSGETQYDELIREVLARRLQPAQNGFIWPDGMRSALIWWKPHHAI
jgi:SAM-dependent methyltransferase